MNAGRVGGIIMSGVNPVYTLPNADDFAEGLKENGIVNYVFNESR